MTKEDFDDLRDELVDKYYAEDAMCKSDLFDLLTDYDQLLKTAHNNKYTASQATPKSCQDYSEHECVKCGKEGICDPGIHCP